MPEGLAVELVPASATIQDLGRPGHMHEGVPPGGALVPATLGAANRALGNDDGDAAIEVPLGAARFVALSPLRVSLDGTARSLAAGEALDVPEARGAVRYVALEGGVLVSPVLGGRGTLAIARLGGLEGRALARGDVLRPASPRASRPGRPLRGPGILDELFAPARSIRVVLGPDPFARAAVDALLAATFRVSSVSDRVGMRLAGPRLPSGADRSGSTPVVRGAIQVTLDGTPIVLGPDHPTTGGYPVIAVVVVADQGLLAGRRPGDGVRFTNVEAPFPWSPRKTGP